MALDPAVLLMLTLNILAWVWGSGRLLQSVRSLEKTSAKLEDAVKELTTMLSDHAARLAVVESLLNHRRAGD